MKIKIIFIPFFVLSLWFISCFKGETGPAGPAGKNGLDGRQGSNGAPGVSEATPKLSGLFRVFVKGIELPLTKTDVDSTQYLFLSETWTFRLYHLVADSCRQVNMGTVEWGGSRIVITDTSNISYSYNTNDSYSGSIFEGNLPDPFLNCPKCELRPVSACTSSSKQK